MSRRLHLLVLLGVALGLRLLAWRLLPYKDFISDEAEYWAAATWLAQGFGFAYFDSWIWTRPPIYVIFLAIHAYLFGPTALWAPRLTQALLSVVLVYQTLRLGDRLASRTLSGQTAAAEEQADDGTAQVVGWRRQGGLIAGWLMALSYTFATFAYLLLSETVFLVLFLAALQALLRWEERQRPASLRGLRLLYDHRLLIVGAVLLGLAALTKALVLTWLPLVALWVLWVGGRSAGVDTGSGRKRGFLPGRGLLAAALLTAVVCAVVLPWSAYATARWGKGQGVILVDTTGGYNFALGAQSARPGGRNENVLHDLLCGGVECDPGASQARRQSEAYRQGWRWIREKPAGFARKTVAELLDMIQLRYGGAERLNNGYRYGNVPLPHVLGLLLDDTLYLIILPLALVGVLRASGRTGHSLVVSWLLYNVVVGALVFAINRFRVPLLPFLFAYAALAIVRRQAPWPSPGRRRAAVALAATMLILVLPSYLYWPDVLEPGRRSTLTDTLWAIRGWSEKAECDRIETVLERGDLAQARRLHDAADAESERPCLALINARLLRLEGNVVGPEGALAFMETSVPPNDIEQAARMLMLQGDLLRTLGREKDAFAVLVARPVELLDDHEWAWQHLQPVTTRRIDIGNGLDYGYILGFYTSELPNEHPQAWRWAGPRSAIRFPGAGTGAPQTLVMRVNGYTLLPEPTRLTVQPQHGSSQSMVLKPEWQEIRLKLPPAPPGEDVVVRFHSTVFVPDANDLARRVRDRTPRPLRFLGFGVDWAELR